MSFLKKIYCLSKLHNIFFMIGNHEISGEKTMSKATAKQKPPTERKKPITYHDGAFSAISFLLRDYVKNGDITLEDEKPLSKSPLIIDIIVIKKKRDVEIAREWGRIFRKVNIIEYKSPSDSPISLRMFDKVIHGYAGIYAWQNNVPLTDMTATIVCYRKPVKLFKTLSENFGYEVLRKYDGIYYITQKGVEAGKSLAIQIVVGSELPDSELVLKALRADIDAATLRKTAAVPFAEDEESALLLSYWMHVMVRLNPEILKILNEEANMRFATDEEIRNVVRKSGLEEEWKREVEHRGIQKGIQRGIQTGMMQILTFLRSGHSLEEAEKKFAVALG